MARSSIKIKKCIKGENGVVLIEVDRVRMVEMHIERKGRRRSIKLEFYTEGTTGNKLIEVKVHGNHVDMEIEAGKIKKSKDKSKNK